jgi:hypothetical protein
MGTMEASKKDGRAGGPAVAGGGRELELLTVGHCSYEARKSAQWIRGQIDRGRLRAIKDSGGRRLVARRDLEQFLAQR